MRYLEWAVMFLVAGFGMCLANFVGFKVDFLASLPGVLILLAISLLSVWLSKVIPLKLPVIAYCSVLGLLLACPLSPVRDTVIAAAGKINFTASIKESTEEALAKTDALYDEFHNQGNLKVFYSLRALMNCSEKLITNAAARARERKTYLQAHMSEYAGEVNYTLERYQLRPFAYLEKLGALGENFLAAHCLMLSAKERALLAARNVKVVHCPFSNCGKGVPDTPALLEAGIHVALGSDGAAHGGLSLWNEMKIFRSVMNAFWGTRLAEPAVMPAAAVLRIAFGGSKLLQEGASNAGGLTIGAPADMIALDWSRIHLCSSLNRLNSLLECAGSGDVCDSMVAGKFLLRNREFLTLDKEAVCYELKRYLAEEQGR